MPVKNFFCYAHEDEVLLNKLKTQLSPLHPNSILLMKHLFAPKFSIYLTL
jgi:hypothetical protein